MQDYEGRLYPEEPVTREQYFVMLARALRVPESDTCNEEFADADRISDWAKGYINALVDLGVVNGYNGELFAGETITRDQAVTVIDNAIAAYANEDGKTVKAEKKGIILAVADNVAVEAPEGSVIVVAKKGADVSLKDTDKKVEVIVLTDDVKLTNVPDGSSVTVDEGVTGVYVNGAAAAAGEIKTVESTAYAAPSSYTVSFNLNGHGAAIEAQTVAPGSLIEKPADPTDVEYGYTFEGWYKDSKLTTAWDFDNDKESLLISDFAGGSNTLALYTDQQIPFKRFTMQNIQCELQLERYGTLTGLISLYAIGGFNEAQADVVGTTAESIFKPNDTGVSGNSIILSRTYEPLYRDSSTGQSKDVGKRRGTYTAVLNSAVSR